GGRGRRKKTGSASANGGAPEEEHEAPDEAAPDTAADGEAPETADGPTIHLPERDLEEGDPQAAPKKRTRRGSRGGRNRRKKTEPAAGGTAVETAPEQGGQSPEGADGSANGGGEWEYTPMSQWDIDDN